ncbi:MAG: ATP-binding protein [Sulfurimonas sp.]|jgi:PAS domain S-box-containing protein
MKMNSIVFKMMTPLIASTILVVGITLFVTQTYLKKVVEDIFIELKVHHLETIYHLKMENILSNIRNNGLVIADSNEVKKFLLSSDASNGKMPNEMMQKLVDLKQLYNLEHIYITHINSRNYFNENGFVKVVDLADKESAWFLNTLNSKKKFILNADSDITKNLHLWVDAIVGDVNNPIGFAGCGVNISSFYQLALEDFKKDNANVIVLNSSNIIRGSSSDQVLLNQSLQTSTLSQEKIAAIEKAQKSGADLVRYNVNDDNRYLLLISENELGLTFVIDFSKEKFLSSLNGIYDRIIGGGIALLFLLLLVGGWVFTYLISRPLKNISIAVSEFDYKSDFHPKGCKNMGYEVDMICNAFNENSKILRTTIDQYKNSEELLRSIINSAEDLIFFKDISGKYLECNGVYAKWISKSMDQIIGKTDIELHSIELANYYVQMDRQVIAENRTVVVEVEGKNGNGSSTTLQIKKSPFYDKDGNILGVVVIGRDITIIKNMENDLRMLNTTLESRVEEKTEELQKSNELLEAHIADLELLNSKLTKAKKEALQAAQARSNFISGISHELRTPLNAIINFTDQIIEDFDEILVDKELQTDTKGFLQRVLINSRHLLQLINDLLEFTKAEAGKMDYKIEAKDINAILTTAYNNTHSLLNGTNVEFNLTLYKEPLIGLVDSRRFLQIVLNLLSNAIKFTDKGSIELKSFEEDNFIVVEIKDTGKGIPVEKYKVIFEPFMQVNSTDNGTGLGLGLAKKMCDDMGIEISFTSVEGSGTVFHLMIKKLEDVVIEA